MSDPKTPADPAETPATPASPAEPAEPAGPETPAKAETAKAETPAAAETPAKAETPAEEPAAAEKSDEKAEAEEPGEAAKAEKADEAKDEESAVDKSVDKEDTGEIPVVPPSGETPAETGGDESKPEKPAKAKRNPWLTVGTIVAVLLVLAGFGYFAGLGPMSRLSTTREIKAPDKLGGLSRITDAETRKQLELDNTRDTLSRVNDGKKVAVEAYGDPAGDKMYIVIALRGKVDLDKTIKADGATPDQVKKVGEATCVPTVENLLTRCYRSSNTLTVIAQDATNKLNVEAVGPIANEAFEAMK